MNSLDKSFLKKGKESQADPTSMWPGHLGSQFIFEKVTA